ncbi:unnamed protein product [Notodromas monacha]|uniref:Uncharacterized protein n=1 Tax=Notodromas monacha TaxID=399045 RepID=A0A7R9GI60_9CRUS|nr:unnamed protein product [Notodromas monacha]CAG0922247.1 unnamed protein product [Notodromas monacha]
MLLVPLKSESSVRVAAFCVLFVSAFLAFDSLVSDWTRKFVFAIRRSTDPRIEPKTGIHVLRNSEECGVSSTPWTKHVIPQSALSKQVPYPINAGRNIAIEGATTMYILPSDVKLVPGPRFLSHKFLRMIRERRDLKLEERADVAFALHLFEVDDKTGDFPMPDKRILMENIRTRRAFRFHIKVRFPT